MKDATSSLPTGQEVAQDGAEILNAMKDICWLLVSSSAFRVLASDVLLTMEELAVFLAIEVQSTASQVETSAKEAESIVRSGDISFQAVQDSVDHAKNDLGSIANAKKGRLVELNVETSAKLQDSVVRRVQDVMLLAHSDPPHRRALRTILGLVRKHAEKLKASVQSAADGPATVEIEASVYVEPRLAEALLRLKDLLSRFAAGHPLDPLIYSFRKVLVEIINIPVQEESSIRSYLHAVGIWLDQALNERSFATSPEGSRSLEQLYDRGRELLATERDSALLQDARTFLEELQTFMRALTSDKATSAFVAALDELAVSLEVLGISLISDAAAIARQRRTELMKTALGWLLPRIFYHVKAIPIPRIEYKDDSFEIAIGPALLTPASACASLLPDHLRIENLSEVSITTAGPDRQRGQADADVDIANRMHIHLDGMRVSASGLGYRFLLKGLVGYEDQGLLSLEAGGSGVIAEGLKIDIVLDMVVPTGDEDYDTATGDQQNAFFHVHSIHVDIPGLHFAIDRSRHWIFNKLLVQPLSGFVVRQVLGRLLETRLRVALDGLGQTLGQICRQAVKNAAHEERSSPSYQDYWTAVLQSIEVSAGIVDAEDEGRGSSEPESQPTMATNTNVSRKGITQTTVEEPDLEAGPSGTSSETVMAIGIVPQVVQGETGAYAEDDSERHQPTFGFAITSIREGLEIGEDKATKIAVDAAKSAERANLEVVRAEKRWTMRQQMERRRSGWKSDAFNL
ncbi:hypothetical protein EWM64_g649 [Hericium alpestre]|uniref:HAM1-like N-terminal domain-containing protein n=1 Tax=Hericium alpestre TaxID=135208 RepID=A0A4Z0AAK2_9AGAM|nr:hypothetical protein EWM64_g649 [Hericium alpestre]